MKKIHLVILKKPYLDAIFEGRKSIESRFTKTKRAPFGQIRVGDKMLLKLSSGPVCGSAVVGDFQSFENLNPGKIDEIKRKYNQYILGADKYWESRADCRFGVLVWLKDVKTIKARTINKKDWRAWVVLTEKHNFGLFGARTGYS
jgi:ASC-1-like (ASCH) protein